MKNKILNSFLIWALTGGLILFFFGLFIFLAFLILEVGDNLVSTINGFIFFFWGLGFPWAKPAFYGENISDTVAVLIVLGSYFLNGCIIGLIIRFLKVIFFKKNKG